MRIVNMYYELDDRQLILNMIVQVNGEKKIQKRVSHLHPYFFTNKFVKHAKILRTISLKAMNGVFFKHEVAIPSDVKDIREDLQKNNTDTFEADIPYIYRYIIDTGLKLGEEKLTKVYWDIETVTPLDRMSDAKLDPIKCISLVAEDGQEWFIKEKTEKETILKFLEIAKNYSILLGWFSSEFDYPYVKQRCEILHLPFSEFERRVQFGDLLKMYKATRIALYSVSSFRLADVAHNEVGMQKLSKEALFTEDEEKLKEYSLMDVRLLKAIDDKLKLTELYDNFAILGNVFFNNAQHYSQISNNLVLAGSLPNEVHDRYVHRNKPAVPPRKYGERRKAGVTTKGGWVELKKSGLHKNVITFDFSGHYPNIIRTFNISFDVKDPNGPIIAPGNNVHFMTVRGIYTGLIERFTKLRKEYKKQRDSFPVGGHDWQTYDCLQESTKYLTNSFYGTLKYEGSRYRDTDLVEAITLTGQYLVKMLATWVEKRGYIPLYSDTDSCHILSKQEKLEDILKEADCLYKEFNTYLKQEIIATCHVPEETYCLSIDYETVWEKLVFLKDTKKRYFGQLAWTKGQKTDIIKTKGIELRRSDWTDLAKETQQEVIKLLLHEATETDVRKYLLAVKKQIYSSTMDEKLIIRKGLSRLPKEYKNPPLHVQVVMADKNTQYFLGDKIPYFVVGRTGGRLKAVHAEKNKGEKPDYEYYWEHQIFPASERVVMAVFENFHISNSSLAMFMKKSVTNNLVTKQQLEGYEKLICIKCQKEYTTPGLLGVCTDPDCHGELYFKKGNEIAKELKI